MIGSQPGTTEDTSISTKIRAAYASWYHQTPAATRAIIIVGLAGTLLTALNIDEFLGRNCPELTVFHVEVWRVFTAGFIGRSVLTDFFAIFSIYQTCSRLEQKKGSAYIILTSIGSTVLIQFITVVVTTLAGILFTESLYYFFGGGFWPLSFVFIAFDCATSSQPTRQLLCFPVEVPTKYFAAILAGIFFLFSGGGAIDIFLGLLVGTGLGKFPSLQVSSDNCRLFEENSSMHTIVAMPGFVSVNGLDSLIDSGEALNDIMSNTGSRFSGPSISPKRAFRPFSGNGQKLGSASDTTPGQFPGLDDQGVGYPVQNQYVPTSAVDTSNQASDSRTEDSEDKLGPYMV
uniref:Uncharacterized protein n=1 Tax=Spongospora subterranea TaxID=70186 RepID=A0A0H5R5R1_9EUKA|eukprot:CRZ09191.1 hypothetical protein [Spongospora subterranea]